MTAEHQLLRSTLHF